MKPAVASTQGDQRKRTLLTTKLYVPKVCVHLVVRPRLLQCLDTAVQAHKLTLISVPAGFGKSTLLHNWISRSTTAVAWLSLDAGDNDRCVFGSMLPRP